MYGRSNKVEQYGRGDATKLDVVFTRKVLAENYPRSGQFHLGEQRFEQSDVESVLAKREHAFRDDLELLESLRR